MHCLTCEDPRFVFVFGSNLAGRHGKGAALHALRYHGARYGRGVGFMGQSYAIPTKDFALSPMPVELIRPYADRFILFASNHPELIFHLTRIGCGLAGYTDEQIAPLFQFATPNVYRPVGW